ncbi:MAG: hypothetical protein IRZ29_01370 [Thermoflavifilum sp.]|nr:hypothetical protein [Thermoflavifilum sp.]
MQALTLLEILIAIGFLAILLSFVRDWMKKKKTDDSKTQSAHTDKHSITLPLQLQAYERLVVFVERISPEQLVYRLGKIDLPAVELYALMVQDIREEYAHNVSQQIYVSQVAWDAVVHAKEYIISQLNVLISQLPEDARSSTFCRQLLSQHLQQQPSPLQVALEVLRKEAKKLL